MIVTGLKTQGNGTNRIISNSCPGQFVTLVVKLSPGEANRQIDRVLFSETTGCLSSIYSVDYVPYANPLTVPFILTPLNQLTIELAIDPCGAPSSTGTYQLSLDVNSPALTFDYYFDVQFIDFASVVSTIVPTNDVYLIDCVNQPNTTPNNLITLTNPSDIPIRVDFYPSLSGLIWNVNGVNVGSAIFIPANTAVQLNFSNNNNISYANFTIDFYPCCTLPLITINVVWAEVVCGDCGINCSGLSIATNTGWVETVPNPELPNSGTNWGVIAASGAGSVTAVFGNGVTDSQVFVTSSAGTPNFDSLSIDISLPNAFSWWFPASTPTPVDFEISIKFGTISIPLVGPTLPYPPEVPYLLQFTTNSIITPTTTEYYNSPFLQNTTYTFTASVSDFQYVTPISAGSINIYIPEPPNGTLITIESVSVKVLAQSIGTVDLDCSTLDLYNFSAIGDAKEVIYDLFYMNGFQNNVQLFFNPWLFSDTEDWNIFSGNGYDQPTSGYIGVVNVNWIGDGLWHDMALFGVNNSVGSQKNWTVKFQLVDQNAYKVKFNFFVTMDVLDPVINTVLPNQRRLLCGSKNDYIQTATDPSVYNSNKLLSTYFYIIDPNVRVNGFPYECHFIRSVYFTARFLDMGLYGGPSEMTNPLFYFYRNSNGVVDLSPFFPTEVEFFIDYHNPVDTVTVWLIAETSNNNTSDFYFNYDASRATIPTLTAGVLNKDIQAPSQGPTNIGGNTYQVKFVVGTGINPAFQYRILAVCYSSTDSMVNTFISSPIPVTNSPDVSDVCCDLDIFTSWNTLTTNIGGSCFSGTVKERVRNNLQVASGAFETCLQNLGKLPGDSWLNYLDKVSIKVYKRLDNTLGQGESLYFYYDQQSFTKNHVAQQWIGGGGAVSFSVSDNGTNMQISYGAITILGDSGPFVANGQNVAISQQGFPFNRNIVAQNIASNYINSNNVLMSWGGQDIYLEYEFKFQLRFLPTAPTVNIYQIPFINPADYEPNPAPYTNNILDSLTIYGVDSLGNEAEIVGQFCKSDYSYLKAKVTTTSPVTYPIGKLIAFIENVNVPNQFPWQGEEESFTPAYMNALSISTLYQVDANFVAGEAYFNIDIQNLNNGDYRLCAIRLPY